MDKMQTFKSCLLEHTLNSMQVSNEGNTIYQFVQKNNPSKCVFFEESKDGFRQLEADNIEDQQTVDGYLMSIHHFANLKFIRGHACRLM